ncbi:solute carrier family 49 member A3-like, partial [Engraulis encrasicolus]
MGDEKPPDVGFSSDEVRKEPGPDPQPCSDEADHVAIRFKVYRRRWFILLVLCLLNCSNAMSWLTFAPVADESGAALGVSVDQVNWLSLVYMVTAIPLAAISTWMLDTCGLRPTLIL